MNTESKSNQFRLLIYILNLSKIEKLNSISLSNKLLAVHRNSTPMQSWFGQMKTTFILPFPSLMIELLLFVGRTSLLITSNQLSILNTSKQDRQSKAKGFATSQTYRKRRPRWASHQHLAYSASQSIARAWLSESPAVAKRRHRTDGRRHHSAQLVHYSLRAENYKWENNIIVGR